MEREIERVIRSVGASGAYRGFGYTITGAVGFLVAWALRGGA